MKINLEYLWSKLVLLLGSHKFWVLLFAAVASLGLNIPPEVKAFIIFLAATVFSILKTIEDDTKIKNPLPPAIPAGNVNPPPKPLKNAEPTNYDESYPVIERGSWITEHPGQDGES